jgi:hypothetical protein
VAGVTRKRALSPCSVPVPRSGSLNGERGLAAGSFLARQMVAAGERVLDVQPKLAAQVLRLQADAQSGRMFMHYRQGS